MRKIISALAVVVALAATGVRAADAFTLVNDPNGYSYLKINSEMDAFAFSSDFKSIGNSGAVGFFKYPAGLEGVALKAYVNDYNSINAQFRKNLNGGQVALGDVKEGDRIGFYLQRNNGNLLKNWTFVSDKGTSYIAFLSGSGKGKDQRMSFGSVTYAAPEAAGAPLPGSLAVVLVGGAFAALIWRRKFKRAV